MPDVNLMHEKLKRFFRKFHETRESEKVFDGFDTGSALKVADALHEVANLLMQMDEETFKAVGGGSVLSDVDFFIRDIHVTVVRNEKFKKGRKEA